MRLAEQRTPVRHIVFLQYRPQDAFNVLILENTGVLAQPGTPQRRADFHAVQHLVSVVFPLLKPGHNTVHPALYLRALPDFKMGCIFQYLREVNAEKLLADQRNIEGEQRGEGLAQVKGLHDQRIRWQAVHLQCET